MDRKVQKKKWKTKKVFLVSILMVFLSALLIHSATRKRTTNIEKKDIAIREVKKGKFEDMIILNGKTESLHSFLINALEGGTVQEMFVENGEIVEKGTPLLKINNPSSELGYLQQETTIIEQINNLRTTKLSLRNQELDMEKELILIQFDYDEAHKQYVSDSTLYRADILARRDFEKSQDNYQYQSKRKNIIKQSVKKEKEARTLQINNVTASIGQMEQSLNILRKNKENFVIKALASGRLSSFTPTLGQHINTGENVAKIDVLDGYKIVAKVDEFYISKLFTGQMGSIDVSNKKYDVEVAKIQPEINNGQFNVSFKFKDESPKNLRMGMSFSIKLFLSESKESLIIPKGNFYSETSGNWVFVLANENKAEKRAVAFGRENPLYYEIKEGLNEGEKVITSSYKNYKNSEILNLK